MEGAQKNHFDTLTTAVVQRKPRAKVVWTAKEKTSLIIHQSLFAADKPWHWGCDSLLVQLHILHREASS